MDLEVKAVTKLFAIKRAINDIAEHFIENKSSFTVTVDMAWSDKINNIHGQKSIIVFRENIYKFIDVEHWTKEEFQKMRLTKEHYLQIWREIK